MRNPEFESLPHYASPTYRVNNNLSSNRDDHRPREPLIYHSMSSNSSILIRENAHVGSFVGNDLAYKENRYQSDKEPPRLQENFAHSYKNFNIIHNEELCINSPTSLQSPLGHNVLNSTKNQDQKIAFSDPSIGAVLKESSRQLDKINKMLEEHRKKKVFDSGVGSFAVPTENAGIPEVKEEANRNMKSRISNSKENQKPNPNKEFASPQYTNRMKPKNSPLTSEYSNALNFTHRTSKNVPPSAQNNQKDMVASYRGSHMNNTGKKKSGDFQSKPPIDLTRQASSGRLSGTGTRSNQNLGIENNKVLTPQSSSSKIDYRNYLNHHYGSFVEVSSPKGSITTAEKAKSKSLNKAKSPRSKQEENSLKAVPKISKNSNLIFKNSKRAKEDAELKQKLTHSKQNSNEKDYQKFQEVAVNQFKILKENSARKEHNGESTPQFTSKDQQQLEYYTGHMLRNTAATTTLTPSNDQSRRSDNIKIVTGDDYMGSFEHDSVSIPSSCKSHYMNVGDDSRVHRNTSTNHPNSTLDTESGLTDSCVEQLMNKRFSYSTKARPSKSPFPNESPSLEIKTSITPPTRLGASRSPNARASPGISPANSLKIYNKILSNPLQRSVEPPNRSAAPAYSEDNKIEIIQSNLRKLQQEYLILAGQKEGENKPNEHAVETRHNIYANPQAGTSQERLSQNKKPLNESERLSSYTNLSSSKGQGPSQESLMKSFKLRQNLLHEGSQSPSKERPVIENINTDDYQLDLKSPSNLYGSMSTQNKSSGEIAVFNRNSQWLSAKQNKIDALNTCRNKEEMKECTFRPFMLTKSLRPNTVTHEYQSGKRTTRGEAVSERARPASQLKSNLVTIESPRYRDEEALQQVEVSSKDRRASSSYKQIHEARRNQNSFFDSFSNNSLNKASNISGSKR